MKFFTILRRYEYRQRVRILEVYELPGLAGQLGIVCDVYENGAALVHLDSGRWVMVWPGECVSVASPSPSPDAQPASGPPLAGKPR